MKRQVRKKINSKQDVELIIDPDEYAAPKPVEEPKPVPLYCIERPGIFTQSNGQQILVMPMMAQAAPQEVAPVEPEPVVLSKKEEKAKAKADKKAKNNKK